MLVVDRARGSFQDLRFADLPSLLGSGDCLLLNDTKVLPARLFGHRRGHTGHVEVFLVKPLADDPMCWLTLVRPGRKIRTGDSIEFAPGLEALVVGRNDHGERMVRFQCDGDLHEALDRHGHVPLPPYIRRPDADADRDRYQTVFARQRGSVAAPTAGLHFTQAILEGCRAAGADIAHLTLHVGLGTFQPLTTDCVEDVRLHGERYEVSGGAALAVSRASRVVCVGTTAVRTIESTRGAAGSGETSLFISPGHRFEVTGAMLTNFHLPKSSLLMLVCAFAGTELTLAAYRHAAASGYRFYSYGDCMLVV